MGILVLIIYVVWAGHFPALPLVLAYLLGAFAVAWGYEAKKRGDK
jgi:hypothetical protein